MGYDMSVVNEDGKSIYDGDCTLGCETHYWRRSIFGGQPQGQIFVDIGMGYWPRQSLSVPAPWPEDKAAEWGDYDEDLDCCPPLNDAARRIEARMMDYLKATYDERPGIACYKLCQSNDGWWVTAAECQSALKLWEAAGEPDCDNGNGDTIPFLRAAARHSGFRVW